MWETSAFAAMRGNKTCKINLDCYKCVVAISDQWLVMWPFATLLWILLLFRPACTKMQVWQMNPAKGKWIQWHFIWFVDHDVMVMEGNCVSLLKCYGHSSDVLCDSNNGSANLMPDQWTFVPGTRLLLLLLLLLLWLLWYMLMCDAKYESVLLTNIPIKYYWYYHIQETTHELQPLRSVLVSLSIMEAIWSGVVCVLL